MQRHDEVEVRLRFDGRWVRGFDVIDVRGAGPDREVWLRRRSDGAALPMPFASGEVRRIAGEPASRARSRRRAG